MPIRATAALVFGPVTALGCALLVLGLAAVVGGRWKRALTCVAAGGVALILAMVAFALSGRILAAGGWLGDVAPEAKARVLAESISALMNAAALGMLAGVIGGVLLAWRGRVKARGG